MVIIALLCINLQRKFLAHSERLPRASIGVSGYPITPLESICWGAAKLDVKLPITRSQSDKYANPRDVWHLGEGGEKPKVRRAIAPWGSLVCVAQHWVGHLNNIGV